MKLVLIVFFNFISLGNLLMSQCNLPNGEFKSSIIKNKKWLPIDWYTYGKYIWIYDDNKPYSNKQQGKMVYFFARDLFEPYDTAKKEVLAMLTAVPKLGRRYKQRTFVKLIETLKRDSLYEIKIDISFKSGNLFSYKYFPIFFTNTPKFNKKTATNVELYNVDKALLYDGIWYTIRVLYKANGTESYFHLTDDLDYQNIFKVIDLKKDNESNFYKYSVYFDNICIKPAKLTP